MNVTKLDRTSFLGWVAGERVGQSMVGDSIDLRAGEVAVVSSRVDPWQALIVVRDDEEALDFLAFVGTYVSTYVPFTAFFRVITLLEYGRAASVVQSDEEAIRRALSGVVICDAAVRANGLTVRELVLADLRSSESFALAKAIFSTHFNSVEDVSERWRHASNLLTKHRSPAQSELGSFWREIQFCLFDSVGGRVVSRETNKGSFVRAVLEDRRVTERVWREVIALAPFLVEYRSEMDGTRERRARAFTKAAQMKELRELGATGDMAVAFLGSLLAGSSFEYVNLISGLAVMYPSAPHWFGFISGAMLNSDVLTAGRSLGRHLVKELSESNELAAVPDCDISFNELRVFSRGRTGADLIPTRTRESMSVELIPGTKIDLSKSDQLQRQGVDLRPSPNLAEARRLVQQLQRLLTEEQTGEARADLFEPPTGRKKTFKR